MAREYKVQFACGLPAIHAVASVEICEGLVIVCRNKLADSEAYRARCALLPLGMAHARERASLAAFANFQLQGPESDHIRHPCEWRAQITHRAELATC